MITIAHQQQMRLPWRDISMPRLDAHAVLGFHHMNFAHAVQALRERARERFRFYRDRGYQIITHDLGKPGS